MKKRLKFECWNCDTVFSLLLETDEKPDLVSECPYCSEEVLIELEPHRKKWTTIFRADSQGDSKILSDDAFPEIIPTKKPNNDAPSEE